MLDLSEYILTRAHNLAFMHAIFLCAGAYDSAKWHQIAEMKVSMESQDYFPHVRTHSRSSEGAGSRRLHIGAKSKYAEPFSPPFRF